jgi:hypothetical protein
MPYKALYDHHRRERKDAFASKPATISDAMRNRKRNFLRVF